jgi:NDP-sugar pyrophosphorylase family protein
VILVGGEGTRLRPLTYAIPKQMLPVVEVPMIERVVGHLVEHGVSDVVLSLGYRPDAFVAGFPDGRCAGAALSYAVEPELLDTAGAIRYAAADAGIDETFLVVNGDVLTDVDVGALVAFHRRNGAEGTISLTPVEDPSAFGVVECDDAGRVTAFIEKPPAGTAPTNMINAGTYVLEPSVLDRIPNDRRVNVERETFPAMVADQRLYALAETGYWLDVGTPERFLQACADLLAGARPGPPAPGAVEVTPGVWHLGAAAPARGLVVGPSLVGDGAVVAAGASVSASVIGAGASVAKDAVVVGSVLLTGANVACGAVVRDSILGPGCRIGEGAHVIAHSVVGAGSHVQPGARLAGARHPV